MGNIAEFIDVACRSVAGLFVLVLVLAGLPTSVLAQDAQGADVAAGTQMTKLLQRVHAAFPGRILKVELEQGDDADGGVPVYEVKLLTAGGDVLKLFYDARTLRLERILGRYNADGRDGGRKASGDGGGGGRSGASDDDSGDDDRGDRDDDDHGGGSGGDSDDD